MGHFKETLINTGLGVLTLGSIFGCRPQETISIPPKPHLETPKTQTLELLIRGFDQDTTDLITNAAMDWGERFACQRRIIIVPIDGEQTFQPGLMLPSKTDDPYQTILRAMTYACIPDRPSIFAEPIPYHDGRHDGVITGYHGLNVLVTLNDGRQTKLTYFQEGMAERNARQFENYQIFDQRLLKFGELTLSKIPSQRHPDAYKWVQENNVPAFLRALLEIPSSDQVTVWHILKAIDMYERALR